MAGQMREAARRRRSLSESLRAPAMPMPIADGVIGKRPAMSRKCHWSSRSDIRESTAGPVRKEASALPFSLTNKTDVRVPPASIPR